jgi:hypothetical protein
MGYGLFRAEGDVPARQGHPYNAFTAGILMSGLNPFFLVWWVTVGSLLLMNFMASAGIWGLPLFIGEHWLCDLAWLSFVSFTIYKTHRFWGQRVQESIFILLSILLSYFGGQFIFQGIDGFTGSQIWDWMRYIFWLGMLASVLYLIIYNFRHRASPRGRERAALVTASPRPGFLNSVRSRLFLVAPRRYVTINLEVKYRAVRCIIVKAPANII